MASNISLTGRRLWHENYVVRPSTHISIYRSEYIVSTSSKDLSCMKCVAQMRTGPLMEEDKTSNTHLCTTQDELYTCRFLNALWSNSDARVGSRLTIQNGRRAVYRDKDTLQVWNLTNHGSTVFLPFLVFHVIRLIRIVPNPLTIFYLSHIYHYGLLTPVRYPWLNYCNSCCAVTCNGSLLCTSQTGHES